MDTAVEQLLRELAPQVLGATMRRYGDFAAAEDAVQDAIIAAASQWSRHGMPDNPRAWLIQVARNKALDVIRRNASLRRVELRLIQQLDEFQPGPESFDISESGAVQDEQLAMIFACCHSELPQDSRVALTLKAVSGFSVPEIARAFLAEEAAIAQRIVRAKRRIREAGIKMTLQEVALELQARLSRLFLADSAGRRPCHGDEARYALSPDWKDLVLFHEYFDGDNGRGVGACHQTGWTALVARCLEDISRRRAARAGAPHRRETRVDTVNADR